MVDRIVSSADNVSGEPPGSSVVAFFRAGQNPLSNSYTDLKNAMRAGLATVASVTTVQVLATSAQGAADAAQAAANANAAALGGKLDINLGNVMVNTAEAAAFRATIGAGSGSGVSDGVIDSLGLALDANGWIVATAGRSIGGDVVSAGLALTEAAIPNLSAGKITSGFFADARIPNLHASKTTSGIFDDARIPAEITRDTELAATTGDLGLAVDMTGNVYFRRDGTGSDSIHLSASGGGYAYVDRALNNTQFDSALGEIRFGGADNSDRAGWYLAVQPQVGATRGAIPQDVSNEHWIRIDNDIYPNIGGGQTTRLTSLLFRHPTPADALSTIYTIDPVATDAEAVDDQGASSGNPYIYTPFQLASVVTAHQSPTHNLPHLAMLPTPNVGDLALLDHDYTQGNRRDAEVTFNTLGASFHGWSDGSVFGRSGTTNRNLSPLQFIRLQYNGSVYTASQIGSTNRSWIDRLDKYVSNNTEYDLGPTTTLGGHFVRAIVGGPNSANIATPVDINLKFTDGAYWLTDGTVIIWPRGEYLWNNDTDAYEHYDGWLGLTVRDHSANAFSGIKELRLHQSLKDFSIPGDPESLGLEISTAWLQPKID